MDDNKQFSGDWAIDANPENDPAYPMKHRTDAEHEGYSWERPVQQQSAVEVLHSNERPNLPAVYGTTVPPSGLSGMIRRYAFRHGEGSMLHWLPLLLADRVNVVEGIVDDLKRGHIPNIFTERGIKAEWKHNPQAVIRKAAVAVAVTATVVYLLKRRMARR